MDKDIIENEVIESLAELISIDRERITMGSLLNEELGMDSVDTVEAIFAIEEKYGIEISNDDAQKFKKVEDVVSFIHSIMEERQNESRPQGTQM